MLIKTTIKIGVYTPTDDNYWTGGTIYAGNLLSAIKGTYDHIARVCLLVPESNKKVHSNLKRHIDETAIIPDSPKLSVAWFLKKMIKTISGIDKAEDLFLKKNKIDVVLSIAGPYRLRTPTLAWIPDFQHIHLPEMFSDEERELKNKLFNEIAAYATRIIVMSKSVRKDFEQLLPQHVNKVRIVYPSAYIPPEIYATNPAAAIDQYNLPQKFLYFPGQFWKHKNHRLAFRAIKILKDRGKKVYLVCSGSPYDYRNPAYFSELLQEICRLNIQNIIILLGLIPRETVFALIRQSVAVLNPSLFEGYGMTIDEADSFGKITLLSNIPAHREQNPKRAIFFDQHDPEELAAKIEMFWSNEKPGPDFALETNQKKRILEKRRLCAESLMSVIDEIAKI